MSNNKYRYDHQSRKHTKRHAFIISASSFIIVAALVITVILLINQTTRKIKTVNGPSVLVGQISANPSDQNTTVSEPTYSFSLPEYWKQTGAVSSKTQNYITWQSFEKGSTATYLTIYTDPLPTTYAVNRELPVEAHGATLSFGSMSGNCADFTNTTGAKSLVPVLAKWQDVDFYCNVPNYVDNQVGTGSTGSVNSVTMTGPNTGAHNFFFLYIDRNNTPDYTTFYSILNSFQVK